MDKKSKIFFTTFAFIIMVSVVATYYRYVVLKDFQIFTDEDAFNQSLLDQ